MERRQAIRPPRYTHPHLDGGVEEATVRNYLNSCQNVARLPDHDHATATDDREDDTQARTRDDAAASAPSPPDVSRSRRWSRAAEPEPQQVTISILVDATGCEHPFTKPNLSLLVRPTYHGFSCEG
jgi:hypothetical protein